MAEPASQQIESLQIIGTPPAGQSGALTGTIVGSGFTLLGALLTLVLANRHARRMQSKLLDAQTQSQKQDHLMQVRRDVYLPAVNAVVALESSFIKITDPKVGIDALREAEVAFSIAMSRILMVGGDRTIQATARLQRKMVSIIVEISASYIPLKLKFALLESADEGRKKAIARVENSTEMLRSLSSDGHPDHRRMATLRAASEAAITEMDEATAEHRLLSLDVLEAQENVARTISRLTLDAGDCVRDALLAVRADMNMPEGERVLAEEMAANAADFRIQMQNVLSSLRALREQLTAES